MYLYYLAELNYIKLRRIPNTDPDELISIRSKYWRLKTVHLLIVSLKWKISAYFRWLIKLSMSLNRPILICCCVLLMKLLIILVQVQSIPDQILFSVLLTLLWLWQCSSVSNIFSKVFLLSFVKVNDHAIYLLIYWVLWTRFFRVFSRSFWTNFVYVLNFLLTVLK